MCQHLQVWHFNATQLQSLLAHWADWGRSCWVWNTLVSFWVQQSSNKRNGIGGSWSTSRFLYLPMRYPHVLQWSLPKTHVQCAMFWSPSRIPSLFTSITFVCSARLANAKHRMEWNTVSTRSLYSLRKNFNEFSWIIPRPVTMLPGCCRCLQER